MYGRLNRPRDVAYASARCTGLVRRLPWSQILGFDGIEPRAYTLPAGVSEGAQNHGHSGYRRILEAWGAAKARSRPAAEVVERTQCPFRGLRTFFLTPSRLAPTAAREPCTATHRARDPVVRLGRSWVLWISTRRGLRAPYNSRERSSCRARPLDLARSRTETRAPEIARDRGVMTSSAALTSRLTGRALRATEISRQPGIVPNRSGTRERRLPACEHFHAWSHRRRSERRTRRSPCRPVGNITQTSYAPKQN